MLIKFSVMAKSIQVTPSGPPGTAPGETIRALRKRDGLTLSDMSARTGLAVSTLSKLEKGNISLSYDKLMLLSKGLGVDIAQLLDSTAHAAASSASSGRRVVHRAGEGQLVETESYKQLYLATELLSKRFTPMIGEVKARTIQEFFAEFGDYIRHPGDEFVFVLEGEVELHTEFYAPVRLKAGESCYFDSDMGHAYLKASEAACRALVICSPRGSDSEMLGKFVDASERLASREAESAPARKTARPRGRSRA
jgi:transcriptional regulator with XRE-family HTH domain